MARTIGVERTAIGQDIAGHAQARPTTWSAASTTRGIQDLLKETFKAFNGSGPGAVAADPVRASTDRRGQRQLRADHPAASIRPARSWTPQIRRATTSDPAPTAWPGCTTEVANADPQIRSTAADRAGRGRGTPTPTFDGIRPTFPVLAANLANFGRIGVIYHKSIEQALVIFPALMARACSPSAAGCPSTRAASWTSRSTSATRRRARRGFIPAPEIRTPADTTVRDLPNGPVLQDRAERSERGARRPQLPVPGVPRQARAHGPAVCRDPRGYVPIGSNPWRGPPVPYGTPVTDPRNITAAEQVPERSRRAPTTTRVRPPVQLPPGVQPGPGPAPNAPFPTAGAAERQCAGTAVAVLRAAGSECCRPTVARSRCRRCRRVRRSTGPRAPTAPALVPPPEALLAAAPAPGHAAAGTGSAARRSSPCASAALTSDLRSEDGGVRRPGERRDRGVRPRQRRVHTRRELGWI